VIVRRAPRFDRTVLGTTLARARRLFRDGDGDGDGASATIDLTMSHRALPQRCDDEEC